MKNINHSLENQLMLAVRGSKRMEHGLMVSCLCKTGLDSFHTGYNLDALNTYEGFFYYQLKPGISSKISYMRWSNAFMFSALTYLLNGQNIN